MVSSFREALDALDSYIMSGETMVNLENIRIFRQHLKRWNQKLQDHERALEKKLFPGKK